MGENAVEDHNPARRGGHPYPGGGVEDFTVPPALERSLRRAVRDVEDATGFAAAHHRLDLVGTCKTCT